MSFANTVRPVRRRLARPGGHLIWTAGLAAVLAGITYKVGVLPALFALAGLLVVPLLLNNARAAFTVWLTVIVIAENTDDWNISLFLKLYDKTPAYFSVAFLVLLLAAAAALLDVIRPGVEVRLPGPFVPALVLLTIAIVFGFATGALGPGIPKSAVLSAVEDYGFLLLPPLIVVNIFRTPAQLGRLINYLAALTVLKSAAGIIGVVGGFTADQVSLGRLSYLSPATNWMEMVFLLAVVAAPLSGIRLPRWVLWSAPLVLISFALGQRRSFWLAAVFALILVVLIASRRTGRRLLLPAACLALLLIYLSASAGLTGPVQGTLITRATSLTPTKVTTNTEDRYRIAELHNVWPAIERQPLEGLGIGVPWPERAPLPFEFPFNHYFTHFAVLYWWMTCGLIGLAAYLLLMGTTIFVGLQLWWRAREPLERLAALSLGLGTAGLVIVELTTTVIPADPRGTSLFATAIGILAVIHRFAFRGPCLPSRNWEESPHSAAKMAQ
jgi:O-antigen ligase